MSRHTDRFGPFPPDHDPQPDLSDGFELAARAQAHGAAADRVADRDLDELVKMAASDPAAHKGFIVAAYALALWDAQEFVSAQDVADIAGTVVVKLLEHPLLCKDGSARSWIRRITRNAAYDLHRRRGVRREQGTSFDEGAGGDEPISRDPSPDRVIEQRRISQVVTHAIQALSPLQRECVNLRYVEGLPHDVVEATLERPRGSLKSTLYHARKRVEEILERRGFEDWSG